MDHFRSFLYVQRQQTAHFQWLLTPFSSWSQPAPMAKLARPRWVNFALRRASMAHGRPKDMGAMSMTMTDITIDIKHML